MNRVFVSIIASLIFATTCIAQQTLRIGATLALTGNLAFAVTGTFKFGPERNSERPVLLMKVYNGQWIAFE